MRSSTAPVRLAGRELHEVPPLARAVLVGTVRRFLDARGFDLAASLAYSALLTLVPLVACVTVLTSTFFGESGTGLYRLLRVLPGAGREFLTDLQAFSVKATSVSGTATLFFLATSLRTFFLIEGTVQALWGSTGNPRRRVRRLGMAISVMILGPVATGVLTSFLLASGAPFGDFRFLGSLLSFGRPEEEVAPLVAELLGEGLLTSDGDGNLALARAPETISLYAVARAIGESALRAVPSGHDAAAQTLHRVFARANREERAVLQGTSLRDLLRSPGEEADVLRGA